MVVVAVVGYGGLWKLRLIFVVVCGGGRAVGINVCCCDVWEVDEECFMWFIYKLVSVRVRMLCR